MVITESPPLHLAAQYGHLVTYWTPIHFAASEVHLKVCKPLNPRTKTGWSPLHSATKKSHGQIVEFIVSDIEMNIQMTRIVRNCSVQLLPTRFTIL